MSVSHSSTLPLHLDTDLSTLELMVLIVIYNGLEFNGITKYNFETIYSQYMNVLTGGANEATTISERDIFKESLMLKKYTTDRREVLDALEKLLELNIIKISGIKSARTVRYQYCNGRSVTSLCFTYLSLSVAKHRAFPDSSSPTSV